MSLRPSSTRTEVRKKAYKTGVDAEEARRRREDNLVEIRKSKREDNLLKKRREGLLGLNSQPIQQLADASQNAAALEKRVLLFLFICLFFKIFVPSLGSFGFFY
jgi:importin subunit alpha-1